MAQTKRKSPAGTEQWRAFIAVIDAGRGGGRSHVPRGGLAVGANPTEELTWLPEEWDTDASHATHVVYHYGTPVAWIDGRDGGWVVPEVDYTPTTSGVQNRIRKHIGAGNYRTTVKG